MCVLVPGTILALQVFRNQETPKQIFQVVDKQSREHTPYSAIPSQRLPVLPASTKLNSISFSYI